MATHSWATIDELPIEVMGIIIDQVQDVDSIYQMALISWSRFPILHGVIINRQHTICVSVPELDPRNREAVAVSQCHSYLRVFKRVRLVPWIHNVYLNQNLEVSIPFFIKSIVKYSRSIHSIVWPLSSKYLPSAFDDRVESMIFDDSTLLKVTEYANLTTAIFESITYPVVRLSKPLDTLVHVRFDGVSTIETLPTSIKDLTISGNVLVTAKVAPITCLRTLEIDGLVQWSQAPVFPSLLELKGSDDVDLAVLIKCNPQLRKVRGSQLNVSTLLDLTSLDTCKSVISDLPWKLNRLRLRQSRLTTEVNVAHLSLESVKFDFCLIGKDLRTLVLKEVAIQHISLSRFLALEHLEVKNIKLHSQFVVRNPKLTELRLWWVETPELVLSSPIIVLDIVCVTTETPYDFPPTLRHLSLTDETVVSLTIRSPLKSCLILSNSLEDLKITDPSQLAYLKTHVPKHCISLGDYITPSFKSHSWDQIIVSPFFSKLVKHPIPLPATLTSLHLKNIQSVMKVPLSLRHLSIESGKLPSNIADIVVLRELELFQVTYSTLPIMPASLQLLKVDQCVQIRGTWKPFNRLKIVFEDGKPCQLEQLSIMSNISWSWSDISGPSLSTLMILNVTSPPREGWDELHAVLPNSLIAICHGTYFKGLIAWKNVHLATYRSNKYLLRAIVKTPHLFEIDEA
ncbi:hypothetical protein DICA3_A08416 [Diutina catenulata]